MVARSAVWSEPTSRGQRSCQRLSLYTKRRPPTAFDVASPERSNSERRVGLPFCERKDPHKASRRPRSQPSPAHAQSLPVAADSCPSHTAPRPVPPCWCLQCNRSGCDALQTSAKRRCARIRARLHPRARYQCADGRASEVGRQEGRSRSRETEGQDPVEQTTKRQEQKRERRLQFGTLRFSLTEKDSRARAFSHPIEALFRTIPRFVERPDRAKLT